MQYLFKQECCALNSLICAQGDNWFGKRPRTVVWIHSSFSYVCVPSSMKGKYGIWFFKKCQSTLPLYSLGLRIRKPWAREGASLFSCTCIVCQHPFSLCFRLFDCTLPNFVCCIEAKEKNKVFCIEKRPSLPTFHLKTWTNFCKLNISTCLDKDMMPYAKVNEVEE